MNTSDQTYGWNGYMNGYTVYYLHVSVIFNTTVPFMALVRQNHALSVFINLIGIKNMYLFHSILKFK